MRDATLITSSEQLAAAVFRMRGANRIAIDTEFMRERTYYPQLCLVQVATDADCFLVDPLDGLVLDELMALLAEPSRVKVLHAGRQDLEVLYLAGGRVPQPIFDTQVAAALLGLAPQIGYAELVARRLGHSIDKGQTRTDWSRRPLTAEQLAYAADDVHHLLQLHSDLDGALAGLGRRDWLAEEAAACAEESLYRTAPASAWRRLKGIGRLAPRERARARALAQWREERAIQSDKPRGWILADETLLGIAVQAPADLEALALVRTLPPSVARKRGEELLAIVAKAGSVAVDDEPEQIGRRLEPAETALAVRLMDQVRVEATRLGISPELLATRRDVEALALGQTSPAVLRGWRRAVIGECLLELAGANRDQAAPAARRKSE